MATTVYSEEDLKLQDGTEVTLRPLNIKQLRKFMAVIEKMSETKSELEGFDVMLDAAAVCLEKAAPDLVKDRDALEEALDIPTINKILEVCGGVNLGGSDSPNLPAVE